MTYLNKDSKADFFQELVQFERLRQNRKWPNEDRQRAVSLEKWLVILTEEIGEFAKEVNEHNDYKALVELAECAAVCQRIFEVYLSRNVETAQTAWSHMRERAARQLPAE